MATCPAATGACNQTINVPLIRNNEVNEPRRTQVDVRFSKSLRLTPKLRTQWNLDIYNLFNSNPVLLVNNNYAAWQVPQRILEARLFKISVQFDF